MEQVRGKQEKEAEVKRVKDSMGQTALQRSECLKAPIWAAAVVLTGSNLHGSLAMYSRECMETTLLFSWPQIICMMELWSSSSFQCIRPLSSFCSSFCWLESSVVAIHSAYLWFELDFYLWQ